LSRRVVVTGIGLVSPLGNTTAETWQGLLEGRSGAGPIQRFDPSDLDVRFGCEVKNFDPLKFVDKKEARRFDRFLQFAVAATHEATCDAGLEGKVPDGERTGVIIGSGIGGIMTFEEQCRICINEGPSRVSPFFVPMFIPNIASGIVSIRYGAKGPNYCTVSACSSSAHAIGEAYRIIQRGEADVMIAGGAEAAITPLAIAGFQNMKALSTRNDDPQKASRPFDKQRDGFVMGDGSGVVILESLEHAQQRGAKIRAELVGYGMSADAYHITLPPPGGEGAKRAMLNCLADGNINPDDVGYINAHGTSTPPGDIAETRAVKEVFGAQAKKLIMGSTKSMTGHLLGAAGGLEFGISVLVLETGEIPPTINQAEKDPECDLDCAPNKKVARKVRVALSNSFGFGGHNASLAVARFEQ
jgi:3-oxoacyl-[acyl-carrier-protein] synthase II